MKNNPQEKILNSPMFNLHLAANFIEFKAINAVWWKTTNVNKSWEPQEKQLSDIREPLYQCKFPSIAKLIWVNHYLQSAVEILIQKKGGGATSSASYRMLQGNTIFNVPCAVVLMLVENNQQLLNNVSFPISMGILKLKLVLLSIIYLLLASF